MSIVPVKVWSVHNLETLLIFMIFVWLCCLDKSVMLSEEVLSCTLTIQCWCWTESKCRQASLLSFCHWALNTYVLREILQSLKLYYSFDQTTSMMPGHLGHQPGSTTGKAEKIQKLGIYARIVNVVQLHATDIKHSRLACHYVHKLAVVMYWCWTGLHWMSLKCNWTRSILSLSSVHQVNYLELFNFFLLSNNCIMLPTLLDI